MSTPINKQSAISIGLALMLIIGTWVMASNVAGFNTQQVLMNEKLSQQEINFGYELRTINAKIEFLSAKLDEATKDRWTSEDMRAFAGLLQALNPDLKIPEATRHQYRGIDANNQPIHGSE